MSSDETRFAPRRLVELWEVKDAIYRQVAHLPLEEALDVVHKQACEVAKRRGIVPGNRARRTSDA